MGTDRRGWATERTWTIKGVSDRTRAATLEAAHACGLNVGEWADQALARAAEEVRHPRPPAATREEVAALLDARLRPIEAALGRLAEQQPAALEEKISRPTRPEPTDEAAAAPSPIEAREIGGPTEAAPARVEVRGKTRGRQRRELPEQVRQAIEELHRAGRSMYAIGKELDVPYHVVYAHVKALGER